MTDDKQHDDPRAWIAGIVNQRQRRRAFELIQLAGMCGVLLADFDPEVDELPIGLIFPDEKAARAFLAKHERGLSAAEILRELLDEADEIASEHFTLRQHRH
jgi:hypothetical protein